MRIKQILLVFFVGIIVFLSAGEPVTGVEVNGSEAANGTEITNESETIYDLEKGNEAEKETFRDNADFLQNYESKDNQLMVFMKNLTGGNLKKEQVYAQLGDVELNVSGVSTAEEVPVTYYCIVDVSGSVKKNQFEMEKAVLHTIVDGLKNEDQMVVAAMGNQTDASQYLTDQEEIRKIIDALAITHDDTNLYKAIADGIRELNSTDQVNKRKCLVVISDGRDEQQNGQTRQDADRMITSSRIPVYTVALNTADQDMKSKWTEYAKLLGSFARESAGGEHFSMSECEPEDAGREIISGMKNHVILTLDLTNTLPEKEELLLKVRVRENGPETYGDTITVYYSNLSIPEGDDPPDPAPFDYLKWVIIGTFLLLLIVIGLLLYLKKKKDSLNEEIPEKELTTISDEPEYENKGLVYVDGNNQNVSDRDEYSTVGTIRENVIIGDLDKGILMRTVILNAIGYPDIRAVLKVKEGKVLTIGGDGSADLIVNEKDHNLSKINSRILLKDDTLKVWDAGSQNGTFVNGVPVGKEKGVFVNTGDTLRIGSFEYRIQIAEKK